MERGGSLSQNSEEGQGMNQFIGQRESTADGQNSDDEDGPMNYKFPATTQGSQNEAGMMSGYYGQRQTASGEKQRS